MKHDMRRTDDVRESYCPSCQSRNLERKPKTKTRIVNMSFKCKSCGCRYVVDVRHLKKVEVK